MKMYVFILIILTPVMSLSCSTKKNHDMVSQPMMYSGYTSPEYTDYERLAKYIPMKDGTKIAIDIYIPEKGPGKKSFPVILAFSPYSRAFVHPYYSRFILFLGSFFTEVRDTCVPSPFYFQKIFLQHGYILAIADVRGSGASYGCMDDALITMGDDGADIINWIADQPWCDGNVGMRGDSYVGMTQIFTASKKPKALKCIIPEVVPFTFQDMYPGGIFNQGFTIPYSKWLNSLNLSHLNKMTFVSTTTPSIPAAPVVDEDGDGDLRDEIPIDKNKNGSFLDDYTFPEDPMDEPQYTDKNKREHIYFLAVWEHKQNTTVFKATSKGKFVDMGGKEIGLKERFHHLSGYDNPSACVPEIMASKIPVFSIGGWFDAFTRSSVQLYATIKKTNPAKLLMYPGYHMRHGPYWDYLGENEKISKRLILQEELRYFDRYLKHIENKVDTEPPVTIYVMGEGWRSENEWPLKRQQLTDYFFSQEKMLSKKQSTEGADTYKADFTHDSTYGKSKASRWHMIPVPKNVPMRNEQDKKALTYTTDKLENDTEVTGHPIIDLWVSSSTDDSDFFVFLEDISENGDAVVVTEGALRGGFAKQHSNDKMILAGKKNIKVLPALPFHGYEINDYDDNVFSQGKVVLLKFDLQPTSWIFKKGHRIRVSIACSNWPTFRLNPKLSPNNSPNDPQNRIPTITVHHNSEYPSRITLPVIPKKIITKHVYGGNNEDIGI